MSDLILKIVVPLELVGKNSWWNYKKVHANEKRLQSDYLTKDIDYTIRKPDRWYGCKRQ